MRLRSTVRTAALGALSLSLIAVPAADAKRKPRPQLPTLPAVAAAPTPPPAAPVLNAIPEHIGHQGFASFRVNRSTPAGVDGERFAALAAGSGARWGLRAAGDTTAQPLVTDRRNVVGFSAATDAGALGVQRDVLQTTRNRASGRVLHQKIIDQDLALAIDVAWQQGPDHPSAEQYDLETVLVHELGHMAGNKEHAELCANSPLVPSAAPGEWWRSPTDFSWTGCGAGLRAVGAHAHAPADSVIEHHVVHVTRWVG